MARGEPIHTEIGTFAFTYRSLGVHGIGISASSNFAVLYEASQCYLRDGPPLCSEEVARAALAFERRLASGAALAADDVYPITYGGVVTVKTRPIAKRGAAMRDDDISIEPVAFDAQWLASHMVIAFDPSAKRHEVPRFMERLFRHKRASEYVKQMSKLARLASHAISSQDVESLGQQIRKYVELFDKWSHGSYTVYSRPQAMDLQDDLGEGLCAWKPPGGGATKSIAALTCDESARDAAISFFEQNGWWATPLYVTGGISAEFIRADGQVRFTAGHRLDIIGAADLGQDPRIRTPGQCCSCAIEPRTELIIHGHNKPD